MKITTKEADWNLKRIRCERNKCFNPVDMEIKIEFESSQIAYEWVKLLWQLFTFYYESVSIYGKKESYPIGDIEIYTCKEHADYLIKLLKGKENVVFEII